MFDSLQDEIKALEVMFQHQLNPLQEVLTELSDHIKGKKYIGPNMNLMGRKHIL
jgi:hypothetical protein